MNARLELTNSDVDVDDPIFQENASVYDDFFEQIDKSIITGDVSYIQNALKMYGSQLHQDSVKMAARIIFELLDEKITDLKI